MKRCFCLMLLLTVLFSCKEKQVFRVDDELSYCVNQAARTLNTLTTGHEPSIPRSIVNGDSGWKMVDHRDWTAGFWPGILWYLFEYTNDPRWKLAAGSFSGKLYPLVDSSAIDHDIGFVMYCSIGNGYRLTHDPSYKKMLLRAADTLSRLFNEKVGTILSWPRAVPGVDWPLRHNTIMDNMMNLELLFWASGNGGGRRLYDMAVRHAATTMQHHFRPDHTSYHVAVYDTATGEFMKGITHQGYNDSSLWARGQSWAIYGFTMVYRETKDRQFLDFAEKVADVYLARLPSGLVPYWDFNDPAIPRAPRDASAACITASALLELSTFVKDASKAGSYRKKAEQMLEELSSARYQSRNRNSAFLLHSTGHKPNGGEVDASLIYADYYYIEALLRLKRLQQAKNNISE